jgi:FHA domain-containing protein
MKVLLIVSGVLFLLLALVLFVAAVVVFLMGRRRSQLAAAGTPVDSRPAPGSRVAAPVMTAVPAKPIPTPTHQLWGALYGTTGPLAGRVFPIDAKGFYIGRDPTLSQAVIESSSVSKRHVWIGVRDGVVIAVDQGSTNGTYLNDSKTPITEARLKPGDTLILGGDEARFVYRV